MRIKPNVFTGCCMKKDELYAIARKLAGRLQAIKYDALPLSAYNKRYIAVQYAAFPYWMKIYADCLFKGMHSLQAGDPDDITLVDYGGGSGFLSILAREAGIGRVIYVDRNPFSVETVKILQDYLGAGPDAVICGDSAALAGWCAARRITPHLLIATDVIEHVYDLEVFFKDLYSVSDRMHLLFTTASTPYNPLVKRRLHACMKACETGRAVSPNYYTRREIFIREHFPFLSEKEIKTWARLTRGCTYEDIKRAVDSRHLPVPGDRHNTCDPATGNWTERILPISRYRAILAPYSYHLKVDKGYYNTHRSRRIFSVIRTGVNRWINTSGRAGLLLAPFLFLLCIPGDKDGSLED
jgi:hypothetical protein